MNERLEPHAYIEELRRVRVSITEITSRVEALDEEEKPLEPQNIALSPGLRKAERCNPWPV